MGKKATAADGGKPDKRGASGDRPALPYPLMEKELPRELADKAMRSGDYPYDERLKRKLYDKQMAHLQIELQKLASFVRDKGERLVILFEGRDGAGKGGAIKRFTENLNPRTARIVALSKPTETEAGQWYFQRYVSQLPTRGEIALFDRSWYNRPGVERVMGFATPEQASHFLNEVPPFERMLVRDGIRFIKIFLTIGRDMQMTRLHARWNDPLKRWKLSPIDFEALPRFDAYSAAFEDMLRRSCTIEAPWTIVRANDKRRARLETIRHVLLQVPYEGRDDEAIGKVDRRIVLDAQRFLAKGGEEDAAS